MEIKINELLKALYQEAPLMLQENYDNSGLLIGRTDQLVSKVLISLDVTEAVIDEAIQKECGLILSHHPLIFKGLKNLVPSGPVERTVVKAVQHDIAVAAMHTNLDKVLWGVNGKMADKLGLVSRNIMQAEKNLLKKLITFCPNEHAEKLRLALFEAGAGQIGDYDSCSYNLDGFGTFRAGEGTNPFVGEKNELHKETEQRIETIVPVYLLDNVLQALFRAHPYEEVAYDVIPLDNEFNQTGSGLVGRFEQPMDENDFFEFLKKQLKVPVLRHTRLLGKPIQKVALCGGSGSFLIPRARAVKADAYVTADLKYHDFFEADEKLLLVDAGHFETEQFTKELLADIIQKKFPNFAPLISGVDTNAVHYFC